MFPRIEFLGYFLAILVGVSVYFLERPIPWPLFFIGVVAYLAVLRLMCRQLAKRFKYDPAPAPAPRTTAQ